jgi:hypothetical protein
VLERHFREYAVVKLSNTVDLEKSFGPIYTRGIRRRGRSAVAALGVNQYETQSSIDAALTFGILWLDACRQQLDQRIVVEGLKLFLPAGSSGVTRERLVHLHCGAAKWHLYEYDELDDSVAETDFSDRGNIATHLVRCPNETAALERFEDSIHVVLGLLPEAEVAVLSPAEIAFRWRGLKFAGARVTHDASPLQSGQEIVFGIGAEERVLDDRNAPALQNLVGRLRTTRSPSGSRHQPLWRLHPERWLESLVVLDVSMIDERLDHTAASIRRFQRSPRRIAPGSMF